MLSNGGRFRTVERGLAAAITVVLVSAASVLAGDTPPKPAENGYAPAGGSVVHHAAPEVSVLFDRLVEFSDPETAPPRADPAPAWR